MFLSKILSKFKAKTVVCECCKATVKKGDCVNYASMWFCSADCLSKFLNSIPIEEFIRLNDIDLNR